MGASLRDWLFDPVPFDRRLSRGQLANPGLLGK